MCMSTKKCFFGLISFGCTCVFLWVTVDILANGNNQQYEEGNSICCHDSQKGEPGENNSHDKKDAQTCEPPNLTLENDMLKSYYKTKPPIRCSGRDLFSIRNSTLSLNKAVLSDVKLSRCEYMDVIWINDKTFSYGEPVTRHDNFEIELKNDFLRVNCYTKTNEESKPEFSQLLAHIATKKDVLDRIAGIKPFETSTQMNVLIYILESASHMTYRRELPLTYSYLENELGAAIMNQYNIVGDASVSATMPILTGYLKRELLSKRSEPQKQVHTDTFPLIWQDYKRSGYATLYAEDRRDLATFTMTMNGFKQIPVDHYMKMFWSVAEMSDIHKKSTRHCLGGKKKYQIHLDYIKDFFAKYSEVPKFAFGFFVSLTHDDIGRGGCLDADFRNFLRYLNTNGYLDDTLLIVMGDHGPRYSKVRQTFQGKIEERLPMMSLTFPSLFKKKYPELIANLMKNRNRLTTPFDIHVTLENVLNIKDAMKPVNYSERGISLLKEIPANRTCDAAGIAIHWCMCLKRKNLRTDDKFANKLAEFVLSDMNKRIQIVENLCAVLKLKTIHEVSQVAPNEKVMEYHHTFHNGTELFHSNLNVTTFYYQISIETTPNGGLYEATVLSRAGNYSIVGDISRTNRYNDQPYCIVDTSPELMKFCICNSVLKS